MGCLIRGEERHFRIKQVPTAFEDGSDGLTFIAEDITPRKKYEEMLRISEARYRGLVQSSGEAIIGMIPTGISSAGILRQSGSAGSVRERSSTSR
jgi:PAS domain-containing protein